MSILEDQKSFLLEQAVQELLNEGISPTIEMVKERYNSIAAGLVITQPQTAIQLLSVESNSSSSASEYNETNQTIKEDLDVLYSNMLKLTSKSMKSFDKWKSEMQRLESQVDSLENRIDSLLITTQDTAGYFSFVTDNFVNTEKVDLANSSIVLDLNRELVTLGSTDSGATRIFLNNIKEEDVSFTLVTQRNLQAIIPAQGSAAKNAFDDTSKFWQNRVYMTQPGPVVADLKIKLSDTPIETSRITIQLHSSNTSSSIQVTPLYSLDNFSFFQLPTESFSLSVLNKATFSFPSTKMRYLKFLMSKEGFDTVDGLSYIYEFGAQEISLFSEGYTDGTTGILRSKGLSVTDQDGNLIGFNHVTLDACELIHEDTSINFSIGATATNSPPTNWIPIDPSNRENPSNPISVNFADMISYEVGLVTPVTVSYDPDNNPITNPEFSNPHQDFKLADVVADAVALTDSSATGIRYLLPTNYDRILSLQLKATMPVDLDRLVILRNVGTKGVSTTIRGIQLGWGFKEPYYNTIVEVKNKDGLKIDFGDRQVIIDGAATKGQVTLPQGFHSASVHKDNWVHVTPEASTLAILKAADPLYPFNHKLLLEGYDYANGWSSEVVYGGTDLFFEFKPKRIGAFDMLNTITDEDFNKYGLDFDVKDGAREPSRVILVKSNANIPDFANEKFVIRLKGNVVTSGDLLFKYVWLRAEFKTNSPSVAPMLDSYRIKLGK